MLAKEKWLKERKRSALNMLILKQMIIEPNKGKKV